MFAFGSAGATGAGHVVVEGVDGLDHTEGATGPGCDAVISQEELVDRLAFPVCERAGPSGQP
jgi:hypothetical protein